MFSALNNLIKIHVIIEKTFDPITFYNLVLAHFIICATRYSGHHIFQDQKRLNMQSQICLEQTY